jgi:endoglucanase
MRNEVNKANDSNTDINKPSRSRVILGRGLAVLLSLAAVAAVVGGMFHATNALHTAARAPTQSLVPTLPVASPTVSPHDMLAVAGTRVVDGTGNPVMLVGVTDYSLEFSCAGDGHFQPSDFNAMRSWGMNTVRFTLSSAFWRTLNGTCPDYNATVTSAVANALAAGLHVILALQWNAPYSLPQDARNGGAQCPLPDVTYDVRFWQDLAAIYQGDTRIIFDLFSEPHDITWSQWANGGTITSSCFRYSSPHTYQAIGVPALAAKVRRIAPSTILILSGIGWGYDLSGVQAVGGASLHNVLYGTHPFDHPSGFQQPFDWARAFGSLATRLPVIATEFGAYNCQTGYIAQALRYFKQLHISFMAWAWTTGTCTTPSLLADWSGTPSTPYGAYIRQQMLSMAGTS